MRSRKLRYMGSFPKKALINQALSFKCFSENFVCVIKMQYLCAYLVKLLQHLMQ